MTQTKNVRLKFNPLIPLLGLIQWGDLGNVTIYRAKNGRPVFFPKTYPEKPPTQKQLDHRKLMIDAAKSWSHLTKQQRQAYTTATQKLSLAITPFALYFTLSLPQHAQLKQTIQRQSATQLQ